MCINSAPTFNPYPVGHGPWEETNLAENEWEYKLPPSNILTGSGKSPASRLRTALNLNFNIEWVFDSRESSEVN
jgi:hypothetical protein